MMSFKPVVDVRSCSSSSSSEDDSRYCYDDRTFDDGTGDQPLAPHLSSLHRRHRRAESTNSASSPTTIIFREVSLVDRLGESQPATMLSSPSILAIPNRLQRANPVRDEDGDDEDELGASDAGGGRKRRRRSDPADELEDDDASSRGGRSALSGRGNFTFATDRESVGEDACESPQSSPLGSLENVIDHQGDSATGREQSDLFLQPRRYYAEAGEQDEVYLLGDFGGERGSGGIVDYSRFFEADLSGNDRIVLAGEGYRGLAQASDEDTINQGVDTEGDDDDFSLSSQEANSILDQELFACGNANRNRTIVLDHKQQVIQAEAFWEEGIINIRPDAIGSHGSSSLASSGTASSGPAHVSLSSGATDRVSE